MSDLVERLRRGEPCREGCGAPCRTMDAASGCICAEAADRIEQLEAALREIDQARYTGRCTINPTNGYDQAVALNKKLVGVMNIARAALEEACTSS